MKPKEQPIMPAQLVPPHRGVAGYTGDVRVIGAPPAPAAPKPAAKAPAPAAKAQPAAAAADPAPADPDASPAAADPAAPGPAEPGAAPQDAPGPAPAADAGDGLDGMPRADLVRVAVSLGLKGSGTAAELAAAIRARPGQD
jgi:hypothetical protein